MEHNKIYLGDSYKLIKQIPDKSIDMIYTDPPYLYTGMNAAKKNGTGLTGRINKKSQQLKEIKDGIDYSILDEYCRVLKDIYIFIWCNDKQIIDYMNYFVNQKGCEYKVLGWTKSNPLPLYNKKFIDDIEYCLFFKDKKVKLKGIDTYANSLRIYKGEINLVDKNLYNHPTIKPLDCVKNHIEKTCCHGMVVLDTFLGSGTTAVACKQLGIDYIGFEINENYYNIANDRLNGISQAERRYKENGQMSLDLFAEQQSLELEEKNE